MTQFPRNNTSVQVNKGSTRMPISLSVFPIFFAIFKLNTIANRWNSRVGFFHLLPCTQLAAFLAFGDSESVQPQLAAAYFATRF